MPCHGDKIRLGTTANHYKMFKCYQCSLIDDLGMYDKAHDLHYHNQPTFISKDALFMNQLTKTKKMLLLISVDISSPQFIVVVLLW